MFLCTNRNGPYAQKVGQVRSLPEGTFVTWGYRPKWVEPYVLALIRELRIGSGDVVILAEATLDSTEEPIVPLRVARIVRLTDYSCPECEGHEKGFVRFDMVLLDDALPPALEPIEEQKGYLVLAY